MNTYWIYGCEGYTKKLPNFDDLSSSDSPPPKKLETRKTSNNSQVSNTYSIASSVVPPEKVNLTLQSDGSNLEGSDTQNDLNVNNVPNGVSALPKLENITAVAHGADLGGSNISPTRKAALPPINKVEN